MAYSLSACSRFNTKSQSAEKKKPAEPEKFSCLHFGEPTRERLPPKHKNRLESRNLPVLIKKVAHRIYVKAWLRAASAVTHVRGVWFMWLTSFRGRFDHFCSTPKSRHGIAAQ
jgi:hypothetical protein